MAIIILMQLEKVLELDINVGLPDLNLQHVIGRVNTFGQARVDQQNRLQKIKKENISIFVE